MQPADREVAQPIDRAERLYTDGAYADKHGDWHLQDAPGKAADLWPCISNAIRVTGGSRLRIVDIGAGVGGVLHNLKTLAAKEFPQVEIDLVAYDIAQHAIDEGRQRFPDIDFRCAVFDADSGSFDVAIAVDVLEHLENPADLLRKIRVCAPIVALRQPLIEGLSTFRHNNYDAQRSTWGHIAYFNARSLESLMRSTGWEPLDPRLVAPWELKTGAKPGGLIQRAFTRFSRTWASYTLAGFYTVGAYQKQ